MIEIQYQGYLCDSWFIYDLPISEVLKIKLKIKKNETTLEDEYLEIAKQLIKESGYKAVRVLKVSKDIIYEVNK